MIHGSPTTWKEVASRQLATYFGSLLFHCGCALPARLQGLRRHNFPASLCGIARYVVAGGANNHSPTRLLSNASPCNAQTLRDYPNLALTAPDNLPMSARPATLGRRAFITLPMSFAEVAPTSAITPSKMAANSASDNCAGM